MTGQHDELPAGLTAALTALARRAGVTLNTLIQAGWALYLSRMTGQHDVIFGATVSGRPADIPDIERMVGLFINTIPVRVQIREDETLAGLLGRVQAEQAGLLPYHQLPLPQIQRLGGAGVLFDTLTVFENYPVAEMMAEDSQTVSGLRVAGAEGRDATHYPLALAVVPAQRLRIRLDYQPALFDQAAAEQITDRLVRVLEAAAADPGQPVSAHRGAGPGRAAQVLAEWNDTARPVQAGTLPELFQAQVAADPARGRGGLRRYRAQLRGAERAGEPAGAAADRPRCGPGEHCRAGAAAHGRRGRGGPGCGQDGWRLPAGRPRVPGAAHRLHAHRRGAGVRHNGERGRRDAARGRARAGAGRPGGCRGLRRAVAAPIWPMPTGSRPCCLPTRPT